MKKLPGQPDYGSSFKLTLGIVKNNADLAQQGRLQVFIPSVDSTYYTVTDLPWAIYVSPFGGTSANFKAGRSSSPISGMTTYGFWAIPKVGAQVLCGFLEGDPNVRYWIGSVFVPELNRTLPQSIEGGKTELDDTGTYPQTQIAFQQANLVKAGLQPGSKHYKTRGGYERSVSYPANKTRTNGYAKKALQPENADSQTICLTSPGRHYFVMSDVDEYCRIRLKTTEGSQIIFDDTNERIYVSTAQGKNWFEFDEGNGRVYFYSDSKLSIRAKNDINFYSDENINLVAKKRVNIKSEERSVNLEALHDVRLLSNQADVLVTASRDIQFKTLNGPKAPPLPEKAFCSTGALGWVYEWSEKGGSSTSSIRFDSKNDLVGKAEQAVNFTAKQSVNLRAVSAINLQANSISQNADSSLNFTSPSVGLVAIDGEEGAIPVNAVGNASSAVTVDSVTAISSVTVTDHMIRPDHEPWVRDEDESKCPTKRNISYQG
jgi:hypothetical protein